jgi:formiminoglutamase
MTLPLLVSVPHAGRRVPQEVREYCILSGDDIIADGDEGAAIAYDLEGRVAAFVTTDVARAVVDMNRPVDDRGPDGVVKTVTIWNQPVYRAPLPPDVVDVLVRRYHRPYHERLSRLAAGEGVALGVDCHTMAAVGPPVGPDTGMPRPALCLSNAEGTCPEEWLRGLARALECSFGCPVGLNEPFRGGYIIRSHANEIPWVQVELSRGDFLDWPEKGRRVLAALTLWCREEFGS